VATWREVGTSLRDIRTSDAPEVASSLRMMRPLVALVVASRHQTHFFSGESIRPISLVFAVVISRRTPRIQTAATIPGTKQTGEGNSHSYHSGIEDGPEQERTGEQAEFLWVLPCARKARYSAA